MLGISLAAASTLAPLCLHKLLLWYSPNPSYVHSELLMRSCHANYQGNQSREVVPNAPCSFGSLLCSEELICTFIMKSTQELRQRHKLNSSLTELQLHRGPYPCSPETVWYCLQLKFHFRTQFRKAGLAHAFSGSWLHFYKCLDLKFIHLMFQIKES